MRMKLTKRTSDIHNEFLLVHSAHVPSLLRCSYTSCIATVTTLNQKDQEEKGKILQKNIVRTMLSSVNHLNFTVETFLYQFAEWHFPHWLHCLGLSLSLRETNSMGFSTSMSNSFILICLSLHLDSLCAAMENVLKMEINFHETKSVAILARENKRQGEWERERERE